MEELDKDVVGRLNRFEEFDPEEMLKYIKYYYSSEYPEVKHLRVSHNSIYYKSTLFIGWTCSK